MPILRSRTAEEFRQFGKRDHAISRPISVLSIPSDLTTIVCYGEELARAAFFLLHAQLFPTAMKIVYL